MAQVLRIELRGDEGTYPAAGTYEAVVSYTPDGCNMVVEVIVPDRRGAVSPMNRRYP